MIFCIIQLDREFFFINEIVKSRVLPKNIIYKDLVKKTLFTGSS